MKVAWNDDDWAWWGKTLLLLWGVCLLGLVVGTVGPLRPWFGLLGALSCFVAIRNML